MIQTKLLIEKANNIIETGNLTKLQIAQLSMINSFINGSKYIVTEIADLPDAAANEGRLVYVTAENDFYFSYGDDWTTVFDSSIGAFARSMYSWGNNSRGQLGDNSITNKSSPITPVGGVTNWDKVSHGKYISIGITSNNIAYAWGNNNFGQLGDDTNINKSSPVTIVGGITDWNQISGGYRHTVGITSGGIAYAWGRNITGQIGNDGTIDQSSPVTVVGGITNWSQVSAGAFHSLGIADGIAYAWGDGAGGYIGDDTNINKSSPVTVVGGITGWSQVSTSNKHSIGIANSIAYSWGNNLFGNIGDNSIITKSSPVTVVGGITNWSQVSAGGFHSLGLTETGIVYAWGVNGAGRLGDGTVTSRSSPVTVVGGITNWSQVSAGVDHSLGIANGIAYAWGNNGMGQLGISTIISKRSPVTVVGGITNWSQVSAGYRASLAVEIFEKGFNEP